MKVGWFLLFAATLLLFVPPEPAPAQDAEDPPDADAGMTPEELKAHKLEVRKIVGKLKNERNKVLVKGHIERLGADQGAAGRDALIAFVIGNKNQEYIDAAFRALATIGDKVSVEFLCGKHALRSRNFLVQHSAAGALATVGDPLAVKPLLEVMTARTTKIKVVGACAMALAQSYPDNEEAVAALFKLTHERKDTIRSYALTAIGYLGTDEAVERLTEAIRKDGNTRARGAAASGLGKTGRRDVIPILEDVMEKDNAMTVKDCCSQAIKEILNPGSGGGY
jgi:HEAT repeat protein